MLEEYLKEKARNKEIRTRLLKKREEILRKISMWEKAKKNLEDKINGASNKHFSNIKKQIEEFKSIIEQLQLQIKEIDKYLY